MATAPHPGPPPTTSPGGGGGGGVTSHGALTGRSAANQHPIGAITGLDAALAAGLQNAATPVAFVADQPDSDTVTVHLAGGGTTTVDRDDVPTGTLALFIDDDGTASYVIRDGSPSGWGNASVVTPAGLYVAVGDSPAGSATVLYAVDVDGNSTAIVGGVPPTFSYEFTVDEGDVFDGDFKLTHGFPEPGMISVHVPGVTGPKDRVGCFVYDRTHGVVLADWVPFPDDFSVGSFCGSADVGAELTITVDGPWSA